MAQSGQKLDDRTRQRILKMLRAGWPYRDVATANMVSLATVWRIKKEGK